MDFGFPSPPSVGVVNAPGPTTGVPVGGTPGGYWVYDAGKIKWVEADGTINTNVSEYNTLPYYQMARDAAGSLGEDYYSYGDWFDGWKGFLANAASWWFGYATGKFASVVAIGDTPDLSGQVAIASPMQAAELFYDYGVANILAYGGLALGGASAIIGWTGEGDTSTWTSFFGGLSSAGFGVLGSIEVKLPGSLLPTTQDLALAALASGNPGTATWVSMPQVVQRSIRDSAGALWDFFTGGALLELGLGPVVILP